MVFSGGDGSDSDDGGGCGDDMAVMAVGGTGVLRGYGVRDGGGFVMMWVVVVVMIIGW